MADDIETPNTETGAEKVAEENFVFSSQPPAAGAENTLELERDTIIFEEGEDSNYAYVVLEGRVELTKNVEGTEIFLAEIGPGDLFGEMGLIDGSTRSATATALETTALQRFDKDELMQKLSQDSDFASPVLSQLIRQLRDTSDRYAHEQVLTLQRAADAAEVIAPEKQSFFQRVRGFFDTDQDLIEFQPDAVEIERQKTPPVAKVMLYVIVSLIVGAFLWANNSTVDTSVSALGRITTEVPNIVVQPSSTAIIRSIRVTEGQFVKKGQLMATLDATIAAASATASRASLLSVMATEKRLKAELSGKNCPVDSLPIPRRTPCRRRFTTAASSPFGKSCPLSMNKSSRSMPISEPTFRMPRISASRRRCS